MYQFRVNRGKKRAPGSLRLLMKASSVNFLQVHLKMHIKHIVPPDHCCFPPSTNVHTSSGIPPSLRESLEAEVHLSSLRDPPMQRCSSPSRRIPRRWGTRLHIGDLPMRLSSPLYLGISRFRGVPLLIRGSPDDEMLLFLLGPRCPEAEVIFPTSGDPPMLRSYSLQRGILWWWSE